MGRKHISAKGKAIDMEAMRSKNEGIVAVTAGTQYVNARGDLLGAGGKVIKTREQVLTEYNRTNPKAVPDSLAAPMEPDPIGIAPDVEVTMDPFDGVDVTQEEQTALEEQQAQIAADSNTRVAAIREQRQQEALARQNQVVVEDADVISVTEEVLLTDEIKLQERANVQIENMEDAIEKDLQVWTDEVTGKEYKTKRGLKNAVQRREDALNKNDNDNEGKAKTQWA